jgi:hypothetical protein
MNNQTLKLLTLKPGMFGIVNDVQALDNIYLEIHNSVFRLRWIKSISKFTDYPSVHNESIGVLCSVIDRESKVSELNRIANEQAFPTSEILYLLFLTKYVRSFLETLHKFERILGKLERKAENPSSYKYLGYKKEYQEYKESITKHNALKGKLNELYYKLKFDDPLHLFFRDYS